MGECGKVGELTNETDPRNEEGEEKCTVKF